MPPKINCILIFQSFKLQTQVIDFKNSFRYVWPWAKDISIAHDSYLCKNYPFTKAFPTKRQNEANNFVGSVVSENANLWQECPKECRPKNHFDWIHCWRLENTLEIYLHAISKRNLWCKNSFMRLSFIILQSSVYIYAINRHLLIILISTIHKSWPNRQKIFFLFDSLNCKWCCTFLIHFPTTSVIFFSLECNTWFILWGCKYDNFAVFLHLQNYFRYYKFERIHGKLLCFSLDFR